MPKKNLIIALALYVVSTGLSFTAFSVFANNGVRNPVTSILKIEDSNGKILEELEKAGALDDARLINEAGGFVQHFKTSPHPYALEAFGSPVYSMKMAPYWNQASNTMGNYFAGYGTMLPDQHFSMYGSGFSSLPTELGGQVQQKSSRFAGTPND